MNKDKRGEGILYPYGKLDTLKYYSIISPVLKNFLDSREIATVIHIPPGLRLLRRATKLGPIYAKDIKATKKFLKFRATHHLKDAKEKFSMSEIKLWRYFFPRKLVELHYAVNTENTKSMIDRVYIDIDRGKIKQEEVQRVLKELIKIIKNDKEFSSQIKYEFFILWTGNSFHLYFLLKRRISHEEFFRIFGVNGGFLEKWAYQVERKTGIRVEAGHEKKKNTIVLDTSQSPPGKLARAPFSLYISRRRLKRRITGIAVPVSEKQLDKKDLIKKLNALTPEKVIKSLSSFKI